MMIPGGAACVQKRVDETFSDTVTDLAGKQTTNRMSKWYKLFGTSFGLANGKPNTATTTNTAYILENGYKSFKVTAALDAQSGGDAIYFRVIDSDNWMRIREYSQYSSTFNGCQIATAGGYTTTWSDPGVANCYGLTTNVPYYSTTQTLCGTTITTSGNYVWEYRTDCGSLNYKLLSHYNYGYNEANYIARYWEYYIAIEKMENGVLSTVGTPKVYQRPQITSSSWTAAVPTTGDQPNSARTVTLTVTPTSISYSGQGVSDTVSNSDLSTGTGVGVGRGSSNIYTASGIQDFYLEIL